MKSQNQKGFTLIELMVVIVIIGILAALAIPRMMGVSAKAKASEAPTTISNWETLQSAYMQETGGTGTPGKIGFLPSASKWFKLDTSASKTLKVVDSISVGNCVPTTDFWESDSAANGAFTHTPPNTAGCAAYTPNF